MYSRQEHLSDGTLLVVDLSIGYIRRSDIRVLLDKVKTDDWVWIPSQDAIRFPTPIPAGVLVTITRSTQMDQVINVFDKGASFTNRAMDTDFRQMLYLAQEYTEGAGIKDFYNDLNMHGFKITNLDDSDTPLGAVNKRQLDAAVADAPAAAEAARQAAEAANAAAIAAGLLRSDLRGAYGADFVYTTPATGGTAMSVQRRLAHAPPSLFDYMTDEEVADVKSGAGQLVVGPAVLRAIAAQKRGGVLFAYPGKYNMGNNPMLLGDKASHIIGLDMQSVEFVFSGVPNAVSCVTMTGVSYLPTTLENVTIHCGSSGYAGVMLTQGNRPRVYNVTINSPRLDGFAVDCNGYGWVENLHCENVSINGAGRHFISLTLRGSIGAFLNESRFVGIEGRSCALREVGGCAVYALNLTALGTAGKMSELSWLSCNFDANRAAAIAAGSDTGPNPMVLGFGGTQYKNLFEDWTISGGAWESISMADYRANGLVKLESGAYAGGFNFRLGINSQWSGGGISGAFQGYVEHLSTGQFRAQFPGSWRQTAMASGTSYAFDVPFPMIPKPAGDRKHQGAWYTVALFYMGYNQADLKTYKLDVWLKYFAVGSDEYWVMTTSPTETGGSHFTINSIAAVNSQGLTLPLNAENPPSALRFSVTTGPTFAAGGRSGALHGGMVHNFSTHNQYAGY